MLMSKNIRKGCVLIHLDTGNMVSTIPEFEDRINPKAGIYDKNHISWTDAYPEKDNAEDAVETAMSQWKDRSKDKFHLQQWLVTPGPLDSTFSRSLESYAF